MILELTDDQRMLRDMLTRALARTSTPARIRESEAIGHDAETWQAFAEMGLPLLRVPEDSGGAGGSLMDAVIVAETIGTFLPLIPATEAIVAARLLAALTGDVSSVAAGEIVTFALADAAHPAPRPVVAAPVAQRILFRCGDQVRVVRGPFGANKPNTGSIATCDVLLGPEVGEAVASGSAAIAAFRAAIDEWKLLTAASVAAAARKAIDLAADYAKEREAFGQPIGSYQGLAHPLAEASAEVDGAGLLVWRAVERIASGHPMAAAMVPMSFWWAAKACRQATIRAMRVFGGYGMTLEYDAQMYFRRVNAWALAAGNPDAELAVAARRLWKNEPADLPDAGPVAITFEYPAGAREAGNRVREVLAEHVTETRSKWQFESDDFFDKELFQKLASRNLLYPDWPVELGGSGYDAFAVSAIRDTFTEYDWDYVIVGIGDMLGKMLMRYGSDRAKAEILPKLAAGQAYAALGYSEPSCGSDIFAVKTRAVRDGDEWVIDGQKMFTSQGHFADYVILLTRTGESKHGGITLFAMPTTVPGYRCHEIKTVGGERTNTTFYDGVRLHDDYRLGEVNAGAKVLATLLALEQGAGDHFYGAIRGMLECALEWARTPAADGAAPIDTTAAQMVLASVAVRLEVADALNRRTAEAFANGRPRKHYGPSTKLFASEAWVSCSSDLVALAAPESVFRGFTPLGRIERAFRRSVPSTVYAGTSEVQRSIIAEAGLGLPRTRA
ncbi:MAG: acyl-CoA dehydrogenase [Sphingomonadales bacterium]|nr:acyl-CoA dehydrogenase [Sphingomonadales bacterium]MBU3990955.1 acyl-CoA dehydrogenase [Alphaproteobacteria bacterium]